MDNYRLGIGLASWLFSKDYTLALLANKCSSNVSIPTSASLDPVLKNFCNPVNRA